MSLRLTFFQKYNKIQSCQHHPRQPIAAVNHERR
nr:MAG TPA: hypothetical protein [Caudoviricetes sp.]